MNKDLVAELHDWAYIVDESKGKAVVAMLSGAIFSEAAAEIERLQKQVKSLIENGNELLEWISLNDPFARDDVKAWERACRGQ